MKNEKAQIMSLLLGCMILVFSHVAFANGGIYQYTNDFKEEVQQNSIDRDYQIEFNAARTTLDYSVLEGKYIGLWDRELNVIYKKLLPKLTGEQKEMLINSQVSWLNWHIAESKFVDMTWMDDRKRGSQGPIQELKARKYRLRERTLELMEYYCMFGGKVEFEYQGITNP